MTSLRPRLRVFGAVLPAARRWGVASAAAVLMAAGIGGGNAMADVTLKYSDHDPPGGMRTGFNKKVWLPEIEKQTGGEVKIQDFFGGALFKSKEILKGVGDGVTDIGFVFPGHYPRQLQAHGIYNLFPRGPKKYEDMVWLWREVNEKVPAFKAELKKANVVVVFYGAGLPAAFAGKKPIKQIADIKGDKWRAGSKWLLKYLGNAGAQPVAVPWGDTYMALQTGTIDGVLTNYDGLHMMKFDEVASNLLISKEFWFGVPLFHVMNAKKFNSLPKKLQDGIMKAGREAEAKFGAVYDAAFDQVRADQIKAGYKVNELSAADVKAWENADELAKLQAEWVAEAKKNGLANADEVMKQVRALHKQALAR
ncbi:MAG: TRAP transporter substrate-binding protein DctP [Alphaproteobacteria bacterium]|nr:TRAP transporter substrate-binding protein DctP [Alphaproteobacteria bacterium]